MRRCRAVVALALAALSGCASLGPQALDQTRQHYNEAIKRTSEEQLLLNIVRLRYTETPSSLAVSAIAAQFERAQSAGLLPFFTAAGGDLNRSFTALLPQAQIQSADRPTISLTPQDDQDFTRKLFTPLPLDGVIYLAKTTWPISTVFRLYLENLNWVPNAQTASGPTPKYAPEGREFLRGLSVLQVLQDRGEIVFGTEEREERLGGPLPRPTVDGRDVLEAARQGFAYRWDREAPGWVLVRKTLQPVLRVDPAVLASPEVEEFVRVFRLKPGLTQYDVTQEVLTPFPSTFPAEGVTCLDLETRSLLQALYYVSHGVEIPPAHVAAGLVRTTLEADGKPFDWPAFTRNFFSVHAVAGDRRPAGALVAVPFRDHWFYVADDDTDTKSTFSLLMELARLELSGKPGPGPQLTLPLGR